MATQGSRRSLSYGTNSLIFTLAVAGILAVGYYIVSVELAIQFDWTSTGIHTLAPKTLDALEKIKQGDREIKAIYFEIPTQGHLAKSAFFANQRVEDMLRAYQIRAGTKFKVQLVDMYREPLLVKEYNGAPGTTVFERIAPTPNESLPRRQSVTVSEVMHKSSTPRGQPLFKGEQAFRPYLLKLGFCWGIISRESIFHHSLQD